MIIGLSGFIGSGKDTAAKYLVDEHGFQRVAFADALKDAVSVLFGWERYLLEGDTPESREFRERVDSWWSNRLGYSVTPRLILQKFGTEACRNGLHQDIWLHCLDRRITGFKNVVIPDVRFKNEMEFIKDKGGYTVRIDRGHASPTVNIEELHQSERDILFSKFDYTINNDAGISDLQDHMDALLYYCENPAIMKSLPDVSEGVNNEI